MALVEYSDSESDGNATDLKRELETRSTRPAKRSREAKSLVQDDIDGVRLPPLPAEFRDLYTTNPRVSSRDDPSRHEGRKRIIPHVEGNWPTHVCLECRLHFHLPSGVR
jgi:U6 snRNA phosphodiesterase